MHIAILADPLDNQYAGIHFFTKWMIQSLVENGTQHKVTIIRIRKDVENDSVNTISIPNVPLPFLYTVWRLAVQIPFCLRKIKPDVVIEPAHFGPLNLPSSIKRVTVIHDLTPLKLKSYHKWHSQFLQGLFLRKILKKTDLVITNSKNSKKDILETFPFTKDKTEMIYLGKEDFFRPSPGIPETKLGKLTQPYFLFLGTIEPRKNLVTLLKSFELYKQAGNDTLLVIAGAKGWKTEDFEAALEVHPYKADIWVVGYQKRENLPALLSNALAFIYPSIYEGFGLGVLEAMACGTPAIISNNSSLPEVGGEAALYFDCEEPKELASHMKLVATDSDYRSQMSARSIEQASKFNWDKFGKELLFQLEELHQS